MAYTNSSLVSYTKLSPNHSGQRTHSIDRITPHCVVGQCSVETLGNIFLPTSRQASSNYGIGVDGRVGMYVEEKNRSWCSSSAANDQRAVTIECASDNTELARYTGDSFRDLTRIARINDKMWAELFLWNKDNLISEMDMFDSALQEMREKLVNNDREGLEEMFRLSTKRREAFDKK